MSTEVSNKIVRLSAAREFLESEEFLLNEHNQYMYSSHNKQHGINLPYLLVDYLEHLEQSGEIKILED